MRGYLPALSQTSTQDPLHFSKSAPNLDKSRPAGNDSPTNAAHNNFLGKSVDHGLNIIKTDKKNNNNYSSTKLGSVDQLNSGNRYAIYDDDDDDDDEDVATPGCFSFISRNDDSLMKRKKHSLDSKMVETNSNPNSNPNPILELHTAVKTIGSAAYIQEVGVDDESSRQNCDLDLADVAYDRVFYRKMQKSLDDISMAYGQCQNQPFEREHFDRERFLVDPNEDNENDSSFDAGTSTNQDFSQKSIDSNEQNPGSDKFSSGELSYPDEQNNSSSDTASTSRKNSVTFRDDNSSAQYSLLSDASNESTNNYANTKFTGQYAIIRHPNLNQSNVSSILNVASQDGVRSQERNAKKYIKWRILSGKKTAKTDMNQQLLD